MQIYGSSYPSHYSLVTNCAIPSSYTKDKVDIDIVLYTLCQLILCKGMFKIINKNVFKS